MKRFFLTLACVLYMVLLGSASGAAKEKATSGTFTGWSLVSIDSDDDGQRGSHSSAEGRSNLGDFEAGGFAELVPWDGATFCSATEVELDYLSSSSVIRYNDGSFLMSDLVVGRLCSDFVVGGFRFEIERVIVGGGGRFEGASGSLFITGSGAGAGPGVSGFSGTTSGTLILP